MNQDRLLNTLVTGATQSHGDLPPRPHWVVKEKGVTRCHMTFGQGRHANQLSWLPDGCSEGNRMQSPWKLARRARSECQENIGPSVLEGPHPGTQPAEPLTHTHCNKPARQFPVSQAEACLMVGWASAYSAPVSC